MWHEKVHRLEFRLRLIEVVHKQNMPHVWCFNFDINQMENVSLSPNFFISEICPTCISARKVESFSFASSSTIYLIKSNFHFKGGDENVWVDFIYSRVCSSGLNTFFLSKKAFFFLVKKKTFLRLINADRKFPFTKTKWCFHDFILSHAAQINIGK